MATLAGNSTPTRRAFCQQVGLANFKHGAGKSNSPLHPTWNSWRAMKTRCTNTAGQDWNNYGGRGITFDPAWATFELFLADMGQRPDGMTLDRINPDGNYEKSNCRWADARTQRLNQRPGRAL